MAAPISERDLIQLNAYLDGEMSAEEREAFERRLAQDAALQRELEALRATVALLHMAERVPLPRSFTLDPAVYGRQVRPSWMQRLRTARPMTFAAAGALIVIALVVGVLLWNSVAWFGSPTMVAMEAAPVQTEEPPAEMMAAPAEEAAAPEVGAAAVEGAMEEEAVSEGGPLATEQPGFADRLPAGSPTPAEETRMAPPSAGGITPPAAETLAEGLTATPEVEAAVPAQEGTLQVMPGQRATEEAKVSAPAGGVPLVWALGVGAALILLIAALAVIRLVRKRPQR